ncbi:Spo11/DNA topoisomerase VI subunit A, partial [Plectosphaerella plurivora]
GKGYPDLSTRSFVSTLHNAKSTLPIYALVDFDPDGLQIMQCYKTGSQSLGHERNTTVPDMEWLGIKSAHLMEGRHTPASPSGTQASAVMPLTMRDRNCANKLLDTFRASEDPENDENCRELQVMLFLGIKGEIQGVDNAGDLTDWLDTHLPRQ